MGNRRIILNLLSKYSVNNKNKCIIFIGLCIIIKFIKIYKYVYDAI